MPYYRPNNGITPGVKIILIINVVMFGLTYLCKTRFNIDLVNLLGLHAIQSQYWNPIQYITHMFMHGGIQHIFFNMFAVYIFGRVLENVWGTKRFLFYFLLTGFGAALLNGVINYIEIGSMIDKFEAFTNTPTPTLLSDFIYNNLSNPSQYVFNTINHWTADPTSELYKQQGLQIYAQVVKLLADVPTIGASGAVFGLLIAFGMLFPNSELFLMFIPIPIKAKYFVIGYGLIELFLGMNNGIGDNVAHFAHLGGMLFGYIIMKFWKKNKKTFY